MHSEFSVFGLRETCICEIVCCVLGKGQKAGRMSLELDFATRSMPIWETTKCSRYSSGNKMAFISVASLEPMREVS